MKMVANQLLFIKEQRRILEIFLCSFHKFFYLLASKCKLIYRILFLIIILYGSVLSQLSGGKQNYREVERSLRKMGYKLYVISIDTKNPIVLHSTKLSGKCTSIDIQKFC